MIQLVCHHYNPNPKTREQRDLAPTDKPKRTDFGPYQFITDKILTTLNKPEIRLFGVHHVALAWLDIDADWTSEKGSQNNNMSSNTVPLLDRAAPKAEGGGESVAGGVGIKAGRSGALSGMNAAMASQMKMGNAGSDQIAKMGASMRGNMAGMGMMGMNRKASAKEKDQIKTLTRTDFLLQFVWVPVKPADQPKTDEERKTKLADEVKNLNDAKKDYTPESPVKIQEAIEAESRKKSEAFDSALSGKAGGGSNAGGGVPSATGGGPGSGPRPSGAGPAAPTGAAAPKSP